MSPEAARTLALAPVQLALAVAPVPFVVLLAPHGVQLLLGVAAVPAAAQEP